MAGLEVVPFSDEHLDDAGRLLAARHARQREAEPTLRERFEDPAAGREEVETAWGLQGASGATARQRSRFGSATATSRTLRASLNAGA